MKANDPFRKNVRFGIGVFLLCWRDFFQLVFIWQFICF